MRSTNVREHLAADGRPKRILALDGGGLRGVVTVEFLARLESLLRARHGDDALRLHQYFDLVAGTSTGAIIAAALACGLAVDDIREHYLRLGERVFRRSVFRNGLVRARYDESELSRQLRAILGADTTLGSDAVKTGLLVVTKRLDTASPWPIGNNPRARYFPARAGSDTIANKDYPLWRVVRASTAAPVYFEPEKLPIARARGRRSVVGEFVDGGVSPFNNPALQALMYATLSGYRVGWPTGADRLLVVSVGTGARPPSVRPSSIAARQGVQALVSLMDDCASLTETVMQWVSSSPTARAVDRELGDLRRDLLGGAAACSYLRYDLDLAAAEVERLRPRLPEGLARRLDRDTVSRLGEMDLPENMDLLSGLARLAAAEQVRAAHLPRGFDLA